MKKSYISFVGSVLMGVLSAFASPEKPIFEGTDYNPNINILQWSDEFDYQGEPNPKFWDYEVGYVRNKEAQYYTKNDRKNSRVENGMLVIEAHKDAKAEHKITSASVITKGKKDFKYGRLEIRAKVPAGRGTWPAAWTLGTDINKVGWPKCGEVDIMEYVGYEPTLHHSNVHTYGSVKVKNAAGKIKNAFKKDMADAAEFHVFAYEWTPDMLKFFIDGKLIGEYPKNPDYPDYWNFDKPHYLILNLAIGGSWGGQKGIDDAIFPAKLLIDYVRYYKGNF